MIVWTDYNEVGYTLDDLIAEAQFVAESIIEELQWPENADCDLLDFARHTFRCGCDTEDAWHALNNLDPQKAEEILLHVAKNMEQ